jgi:hypothetical protein
MVGRIYRNKRLHFSNFVANEEQVQKKPEMEFLNGTFSQGF